MGAAFPSAGGYHHHIGINAWNSLDGEIHTQGEAGLEYFTIIVPDRSSINVIMSIIHDSTTSEKGMKQHRDEENQILVRDPDGIHIAIKSK